MDLNQPWEVRPTLWGGKIDAYGLFVGGKEVAVVEDADVAAQILLWARAEEVQRRRGWGVRELDDGWQAVRWHGGVLVGICSMIVKPTPAEALVTADEYLKQQEAAQKEGQRDGPE